MYLMKSVSHFHVRGVLAGDVSKLGSAFFWHQSVQGSVYWDDRYYGRVALSEEDRSFLKSLLSLKDDGPAPFKADPDNDPL
jgi:hypothetical protein